jgi:hypothetical protein
LMPHGGHTLTRGCSHYYSIQKKELVPSIRIVSERSFSSGSAVVLLLFFFSRMSTPDATADSTKCAAHRRTVHVSSHTLPPSRYQIRLRPCSITCKFRLELGNFLTCFRSPSSGRQSSFGSFDEEYSRCPCRFHEMCSAQEKSMDLSSHAFSSSRCQIRLRSCSITWIVRQETWETFSVPLERRHRMTSVAILWHTSRRISVAMTGEVVD